MTNEPSSTRRGVLAATGATLLAGCGGLGGVGGTDDDTISSYRLPDVADDGEVDPVLVEAIPVRIEQAELDARMRRVTDLVDRVPVPLDASKIPNGVVRQRLLNATDDATTYAQRARTAQTRFSALHALRRARENARYAAEGWAYVEADRSAAELQTERREAVSRARTLRAELDYRGSDPVRAALVYARIEQNLGRLLSDQGPHVYESSPLLTVAEWGEHAESARALSADTRYLYGQYLRSFPDDAGSVGEQLDAAAATLAERVRARREELPPEPTEDERDIEWRIRYRLWDDADSATRRMGDASGPADTILTAVASFTAVSAFERIRTRLEDGDGFGVETAADVRKRREDALQAIRSALHQSPHRGLARPVLADAARTVAYADHDLGRFRGDVRPARLRDPIRQYVTATVRARSVPSACQDVLDALSP